MTTYFQKKVWLGFIAAMSLITWLAFSSYVQNKKFEETSTWVAHTNHVLFHTERLLSLTIDLEAGQRGYSLTGKEEFLEPATLSANSIREHVNTMVELTADNQSQQIRMRRLKTLIEDKLQFTLKAISLRKESFEEARDMNASLYGKTLMDEIRHLVKEIQAEENGLLQKRTELTRKTVNRFYVTFTALLFAVGVILILVFYSIYINLKARTQAETSLRSALDQIRDMYDNAPCGYHSINNEGKIIEINNTWLQWLQYKRHEIVNKIDFTTLLTPMSAKQFSVSFDRLKKEGSIYDLDLEMIRKDGSVFSVLLNAVSIYNNQGEFVKTRSTVIDYTTQRDALNKVEQLNKELESFSYSVSHDLRAPLRSIDGYTQILIEDYADKLDTEGNRLLNIVVNNARRMAQLIDDLLDFSRVSRKEITKTEVNVQGLVESVLNEIKAQEPERNIEVTIGQLNSCMAEPSLIRQVWYNLISNAVKYTRKKEKAVIIISSKNKGDEVEYSIKDNGTGFDMQYAPKLFGVFQRLHRQQEFEGTGVGLAIVHRIISRHDGRISAKGVVNEGAEFNFTLPLI